ncbi:MULTISPECIES: antiterminator LoaP [unclassified Adlercreutzia]|uniref:antiterminator LoaP n=1 Tax=unclassified Adlercreutzia TaxID=2636013 RepID=UPI001F1550C0|nr:MULTISPECIES: antiterminator LoaP [unclassified Adlercreutzia]
MGQGQKWYVVQVYTGCEETARTLIGQVATEGEVRECFVPKYETMINFRGEWVSRTRALFPGYLIVVTANVDKLDQALRKVAAFTRLLGNDEGFIPLDAREIDWISAFTQEGRRVVGMSEGVQEGDEITILKGPLMNHTGWIKRINKRKRLAYLEIQMFGRTITTKAGLNIVRRKP